ncbi:hypothetical protein GH714_037911 [Hevea brasiliensis]|uniref:Uncharacterized protein n=1 Tax=Hevea brasiliensis TaxID=3981 RepID=A0A6A6KYQ6_HEVBR|nr:hypothetical protein GH714_037911 [Hevea brasiliensis]
MPEEAEESTSVPLSHPDNGGDDPEDPAKFPRLPPIPLLARWLSRVWRLNSMEFTDKLAFNHKTEIGLLLCSPKLGLKEVYDWMCCTFPHSGDIFITWWLVQFVDGFFSPIYERLGIDVFGLGFVTSLVFVFFVGVFVSSWIGSTVFWLGEWFIKRMPFVRHLYSASKQISAAISPGCLKPILISISTPQIRIQQHLKRLQLSVILVLGEYAFGFITSTVILQRDNEDEELCSVFVPTNHLYIGDIFLVNSKDIIRPNLSIREGIEIIVSGGMTMPQMIMPLERIARQSERIPLNRIV